MYVSRFSNPELRTGKYTAVRICVGSPKWNLGYELAGEIKDLMPFGLLQIEDKELYEKKYRERLDRIGIERIQKQLDAFGNEKPVVLLCYEDVRDPSQWCHRTMFAQWLLEQTGEIADELPDPSRPKLKNQPGKLPSTRTLGQMAKAMNKAEEHIKEREAENAQMSMFGSDGIL